MFKSANFFSITIVLLLLFAFASSPMAAQDTNTKQKKSEVITIVRANQVTPAQEIKEASKATNQKVVTSNKQGVKIVLKPAVKGVRENKLKGETGKSSK